MTTLRMMANSQVRSEPKLSSKRSAACHARTKVSWTASSARPRSFNERRAKR